MQATVYNLAGGEVETIDLDDAIFGVTPNIAVIQQAVLRQQANARQGTHDTKTRADVSGGGKKPWRQKGTGRARQGSTRSPQWRHGGVVFGPHPRSYVQDMPRKMRRIAIRGVLSAKAAEGQLVVVDSFDGLEPRTKAMSEALVKLNVGEKTALIMVPTGHNNLEKAASNLHKVKTMSVHLLSIVDMLKYDYVIMPKASLEIVTGILGNHGGRRSLTLAGDGADGGSTEAGAVTMQITPEVTRVVPTPDAEQAEATMSPTGAETPASVAVAEENVAFEPTGEVAQIAEETTEEAES